MSALGFRQILSLQQRYEQKTITQQQRGDFYDIGYRDFYY